MLMAMLDDDGFVVSAADCGCCGRLLLRRGSAASFTSSFAAATRGRFFRLGSACMLVVLLIAHAMYLYLY